MCLKKYVMSQEHDQDEIHIYLDIVFLSARFLK